MSLCAAQAAAELLRSSDSAGRTALERVAARVFFALPSAEIKYRNFPVNSFSLFVSLMSRRGAPVPDRKEFFGLNAGAAKFPSVPPADEPRSARALRRRRAKDAIQASPSPDRSSSPPAGTLAGAVPKASPAKGDRPREPVAPSTAVPAPRGKIIQVKLWEENSDVHDLTRQAVDLFVDDVR